MYIYCIRLQINKHVCLSTYIVLVLNNCRYISFPLFAVGINLPFFA